MQKDLKAWSTNLAHLNRRFEFLAGRHQEDHAVDARVKRRLRLEGLPIPEASKNSNSVGLSWEADSSGTNVQHNTAVGQRCLCPTRTAAAPVAGLVSAVVVGEAGADEHVFVDASAQAVDVRRHLASRLRQRQNQLQGFGAVSGMIPPVVLVVVQQRNTAVKPQDAGDNRFRDD